MKSNKPRGNMTSPFLPSSFTYGDAPSGGAVMPMVVVGRDPSNTTDKNYPAGYLWLSSLDQKVNGVAGSGNLFVQAGNSAGLPNWTIISAGAAGALNTLSDGSTLVLPIGGNIALVSTPNQVTVTSSGPSHELIFSIPGAFIAPGSIASTTTLTSGGALVVTTNATIGNNLTVTNDASVGGNLTVTGSITLGGLTVAGTVNLNVTGNAATNIGNSAGSGAITIDVPSGDLQINGNGNEIHIGDDAAANVLVIGSNTLAASTHIQAGTGDLLIDGAVTTAMTMGSTSQTGLITIGRSTAGQNISIGSAVNASAQEIDIANGASAANSTVKILSGIGTAGAGVLQMANNTRVTTIDLGNIAPAAARLTTIAGGNQAQNDTVSVLAGAPSANTQIFNLLSGAASGGTQTVNIFSGNSAAATQAFNLFTGTGAGAINIGTGGTGVKTIAIGGTAANVITVANTQTAGSYSVGNAMVTGTIQIGGTTNTGTLTIAPSTAAAGQTINFATGAGGVKTLNIASGAIANVVTIGTTTASGQLILQAGSGATGLKLNAAGNVQMVPATDSQASPSAASTVNNRVGVVTFTGFTTAAAGTQDFTITNSTVLTSSGIHVTVANLNASTNGAQMSLVGVTQAAGSFVVHTKNNGGGALGAGDNVLITFWVIS